MNVIVNTVKLHAWWNIQSHCSGWKWEHLLRSIDETSSKLNCPNPEHVYTEGRGYEYYIYRAVGTSQASQAMA